MVATRTSVRLTSETIEAESRMDMDHQSGRDVSEHPAKRQRIDDKNFDTESSENNSGNDEARPVNDIGTIHRDYDIEKIERPFNRLPGSRNLYGPWNCRMFASLDDVEGLLYKRRWRPEVNSKFARRNQIPSTFEAKAFFAQKVFEAMIDFSSGFVDKLVTRNKTNRLLNQEYDQLSVQGSCLLLIENAVRLHLYGCTLLAQRDPTLTAAKTTKQPGTLNGETAYKLVKGGQAQRDLPFADRINRVCAAVRHSKACATAVLDGDGKRMLAGPDLIAQSKRAYMVGNATKQEVLRNATQAKKGMTERIWSDERMIAEAVEARLVSGVAGGSRLTQSERARPGSTAGTGRRFAATHDGNEAMEWQAEDGTANQGTWGSLVPGRDDPNQAKLNHPNFFLDPGYGDSMSLLHYK